MNFTPFGGSFTSVPGTVHQFTTSTKFPQNVATPAGQAQPTFLQLPITIAGSKPGDPPQQQMLQIQLVTPSNQPIGTISLSDNSQPKYQIAPIALQNFPGGNATVLHLAYNSPQGDTIELPMSQLISTSQVEQITAENGEAQCNNNNNNSQTHQIHIQTHDPHQEVDKSTQTSGKQAVTITQVKVEKDKNCFQEQEHYVELPANWQSLTAQGPIVSVADCLSKLPAHNISTFIKLSADAIKREQELEDSPLSAQSAEAMAGDLVTTVEEDPLAHDCQTTEMTVNPDGTTTQIVVMTPGDKKNTKVKKKYKKKPPKQRRQMPGRVNISVDEEGTKHYHCPECAARCTEMELLEQHLATHKTERRFICDLCGAALKRKEHLERHKLGHNPERPYTCSTCFKGFKRKEHLNLHVVIHSGEKTQVCTECGKGFYRKDHLRKHARSHLTKKIKEESGLVLPVHLQAEQAQAVQESQAQQSQTINDSTRVLMILPDHAEVSEDASMEGHPHHLEATVILPSGVETSTMALMQQHH